MDNLNFEVCPHCGNQKTKSWRDLTDDEKILIEKLRSKGKDKTNDSPDNRWCARCLREIDVDRQTTA